MEGRRTMIWGGAVAALALLSLGGATVFNGGVVGMATGGSGGCDGAPSTVPDEIPDNVMVAEPIGRPQAGPRPAAADLDALVVEGKLLIKVSEAVLDSLQDGEDGVTLDAERLVELGELQISNPTFTFHDRDSDLIEHFLDGGTVTATPERLHIQGEVLPHVERIVLVEVAGANLDDAIAQLERLSWVEWAEKVVRLQTASTADLSGYQWNVDTLQTTAAHEIATGAGIKVAVVDSGIQAYEDGFRDLRGDLCLDLVDDDLVCEDPNGHGTHMAGVIAQVSDNDVGTIGIAPDVTLIPVRVADADGIAFSHEVANGIVYAANEGAKVISVGVGGYLDSKTLRDAVDYAERVGAVVVAPAGNDGYPEAALFPAAFRNVIGVGCVDMTASVCDYSNRGPGVDVYAPGGTVKLDQDGDGLADGILAEGLLNGRPGYVMREGTSVASAHVAAEVALVFSMGPDRMPQMVRQLVVGTVDPATVGEKAVASGMINPLATLERLRDLPVGEKAEGETCQNHVECSSGVCEGQGCGDEAPGTCAPVQRSCTLDRRPYCGCDDVTFFASGTCANERFQAEGACD